MELRAGHQSGESAIDRIGVDSQSELLSVTKSIADGQIAGIDGVVTVGALTIRLPMRVIGQVLPCAHGPRDGVETREQLVRATGLLRSTTPCPVRARGARDEIDDRLRRGTIEQPR